MSALNVRAPLSFSRSMFRYRNPDQGRGGWHEAPLDAAEEVVRELRLAVGDVEASHVTAEPERPRVRDAPHDAAADDRVDHAAAIPAPFSFGRPSDASTHMNRPPSNGST